MEPTINQLLLLQNNYYEKGLWMFLATADSNSWWKQRPNLQNLN